MKKVLLFAVFALTFVFAQTSFATTGESMDPYTNDSSISISLNAALNGSGAVDLSWTKYMGGDLKWYKVVRSSTNSSPYYPVDGYIQVYTDSAQVSFVDNNPSVGVNYYRVCVITNENKRGCSNTVKIEKGENYEEESNAVFADVSDTDPNFEAINYLKEEGVVNGYTGGKFLPEAKISRAEFLKIVILAKDLKVGNELNCFKDVTDEWFAPYICYGKKVGLVKGYADGSFKPENDISFAEAAKIIVETYGINKPEVDSTQWYFVYVMALDQVNSIPDSVLSLEEKVSRAEISEMVWRVDTNNISENSKDSCEIIDCTKDSSDTSAVSVSAINLTGNANGNVSWTVSGESEMGFKLVWSKIESPVYPNRDSDRYQYYSDAQTRSGVVEAFDGAGTYYVRVCEYLGGACGVYSNQINLQLGSADQVTSSNVVSSINLVSKGSGNVSWTVTGYSSKGFKVVWSKITNPVYPTRESDKYLYYSEPSTSSATVTSFNGSGKYYVRVCEYLGGACGVYSNQIEVNL